jgi:hypothetical protein
MAHVATSRLGQLAASRFRIGSRLGCYHRQLAVAHCRSGNAISATLMLWAVQRDESPFYYLTLRRQKQPLGVSISWHSWGWGGMDVPTRMCGAARRRRAIKTALSKHIPLGRKTSCAYCQATVTREKSQYTSIADCHPLSSELASLLSR